MTPAAGRDLSRDPGHVLRSDGDSLHEAQARDLAGAERLDALAAPDAAGELHTQILELWRKRSRELAEVVSAKSFDAARASELLYGTDPDGALLDELYILPQ